MSDTSPTTLLWTFVAGILAVAILLAAFGAALVIYQHRYVKMHRAYAQRLLLAQEEERAWVAREVHDDAVQRIAMIRREVDSLHELTPPLTQEQVLRIGSIQEEMQDLSELLRGLAHRLHPALIEKGGLGVAITALCAEVERGYGLTVTQTLPARLKPLAPLRALAIYRIAQEALRNVATHSGAKAATVELSQNDAGTELTVSDAGAGFDAKGRRPSDGLGLIGMRERAHLAQGSVTISSRAGQGTVVRASFPSVQELPA